VEEQCFSDDAGVGVLLRAEDELIDDYVRGALSASDRRLFESHFICTEGRRQRLETVKSLVDVLGQMELPGRTVSSERSRRSLAHAERPAHKQLTLEAVEQLLNWLDSDYQKAAEKLLNIRNRLIKLFTARGVSDAERLADETVDRVASKAAQLETYVGDQAIYFYRVAKFVMLEGTRAKQTPLDVKSIAMENERVSDQQYICFEKCLEQLSEADRDLVLNFYAFDKKQKIASRTKLAQSLGISPNALRLRAYRIRHALKKCVESRLQHAQEQPDDT